MAEAEADLAPDGSSVAGRYHVEYYGYKPTFYDIGNTCSLDQAGSDITTTVTVQYSTVQYSTAPAAWTRRAPTSPPPSRYSTVQYSTVRTVQYSTVRAATTPPRSR